MTRLQVVVDDATVLIEVMDEEAIASVGKLSKDACLTGCRFPTDKDAGWHSN
jgi:hypothetical protein